MARYAWWLHAAACAILKVGVRSFLLLALIVGAWLSLARAPGSGPGGRWFKSTRPDHFFRISNLPHTKIRIAPGALPGARWLKSICPDSLFCLSNQCGALRPLLRLQLRLYGQYGQRHHIRGFAWKFEALPRPSHERRGTPLIFYFRSRSPRPRFESFRPTQCPPANRHGAKVR